MAKIFIFLKTKSIVKRIFFVEIVVLSIKANFKSFLQYLLLVLFLMNV